MSGLSGLTSVTGGGPLDGGDAGPSAASAKGTVTQGGINIGSQGGIDPRLIYVGFAAVGIALFLLYRR